MHVTDLEGNEYALQATSTNEGEVNGNQFFSATIEYNKVNKLFIENLDRLWNVVDHDSVEHVIKYCKRQGKGSKMSTSIKAIPLFFDVLDNDRIYERYDKHMTAQEAFSLIFVDTGFNFVLVDSFSAIQWEGFGDGESKLESFKRAINRYKCEFRIVGKTIFLHKQIGRDTSIMYRYRLNASNIIQEIDANEMWTYARGYGDYEDGESENGGWQNAKLVREYTSPLASILGIRHAPPIKDGRVKIASEMDASLKSLVDESLKISVSADIHDLRKQNYPIGQSELGDRVFLIDERIDLNDEVRVISQSITRDWEGNVININITFGSEGITKRHQSAMNTALKNITELYEGRKQLPLSFLDQRVQDISRIINGNNDSVFKYMPNGVMGHNGDNPNYMTRYVGDAIGFSKDAGSTFGTAMSAELGIVADYITTGTLDAALVRILSANGFMFLDGNQFIAIDPNNPNKFARITPGEFYAARGALTIERPDGVAIINNGIPQWEYAVSPAEPPFTSGNVTIRSRYWTTDYTTSQNCQFWTLKRMGRYLNVEFDAGMVTKDGQNFVSGAVEIVNGLGDLLATQVIMEEMSGDVGRRYTLRIDFGVPQLNAYGFYMRIRTGATARGTIWARKVRIWVDG
ncbi:hypothetical protein CHI07_17155 [Paenibacillus sp. 7884-2]|nr:hypothetical protein CHI07_17155 [Paenibacillus sp. 7884-2]